MMAAKGTKNRTGQCRSSTLLVSGSGIGKEMNPLDPSEFRSDVLSGKHDGKLDIPPYCLFVMGINQHRRFDKWPVPGTPYRNYYLSSPFGGRTGSLTAARAASA